MRSVGPHPFRDALANVLVDIAPVIERSFKDRFGDSILEVCDDVGNQSLALSVIHDVAHEGPGLAEVIVILAQGVGGPDEIAVGTPDSLLGIAFGVGHRAALGVGGVNRIGDVIHAHRAALAVAVDRAFGAVDGDLFIVDAEACTVGVGIGDQPGEEHFIGAWADAGHEVVRLEGGLFDLGVEIGRIAVEGEAADFVQGIVGVRPDLGEVEGIEAVGFGVLEGHDLDLEGPAGIIPIFNGIEEVAAMEVGVFAGDAVGLGLGKIVNALVGLEVVFDPEALALGVDPHEGMAGVAVHVAVAFWDAAIAHEDGDLVGGFGGQGPEVPLHVVVAQAAVGAAFLGMDEVLEFHGIPDEENGRVVADHVVIALGGVKPESKAAHVTPGVGATAFAGHRGEPGEHVGLDAGLEEGCLGVGADVLGDLEMAEGSGPLGMGLAVGDHLAVEIGHLFGEIVILEQDGAVGAHRQRIFVAGYRDEIGRASCRERVCVGV